jgi:hypothetical protein
LTTTGGSMRESRTLSISITPATGRQYPGRPRPGRPVPGQGLPGR